MPSLQHLVLRYVRIMPSTARTSLDPRTTTAARSQPPPAQRRLAAPLRRRNEWQRLDEEILVGCRSDSLELVISVAPPSRTFEMLVDPLSMMLRIKKPL